MLLAALFTAVLASTPVLAQETPLPDSIPNPYRDIEVDTLFEAADSSHYPAPLPEPSPASTQLADTLSLQQAVAAALRQNQDVRIAQGQADIAGENYSLGNAGFLPSADLTLRRSRQPGFGSGFSGDTTGGGGTGSLSSGSGATTNLSLSASYTLFEGLRRLHTYRRLGVRQEQGRIEARYAAERTVAEVVTQYYDLARRQQQIRVLEEAVSLSEDRLRITEARLEVGLDPELAVRQARIDLNEDRAALLNERAALAEAQATFNQLLGRSDTPGVVTEENLVPGPPLDLDALEAEALEQNRALRAARRARRAAVLREEEVEAEWYPRLDLTAGYSFDDVFIDEVGLTPQQPGGFSYGLTATFDVFEGLNRDRRRDIAEIETRNRSLEIDRIRTRLRTALRSAYERYHNSRIRVRLELENLNAARLNAEVALARYRLGTITFVELREVQNALTNLRSRLLQAQLDAKRAETDLLLLSGRLLERFRP